MILTTVHLARHFFFIMQDFFFLSHFLNRNTDLRQIEETMTQALMLNANWTLKKTTQKSLGLDVGMTSV